MKYLLFILLTICTANFVRSQNLVYASYSCDNVYITILGNEFKMETTLMIGKEMLDRNILWFDGKVEYNNDTICFLPKYDSRKLNFLRMNHQKLVFLNSDDFYCKKNPQNIRWDGFGNEYVLKSFCEGNEFKIKTSRNEAGFVTHFYIWEHNQIIKFYDVVNERWSGDDLYNE